MAVIVASTRQLYLESKDLMEQIGEGDYCIITHRGEPLAMLMPLDLEAYAKFLADQVPDIVQYPFDFEEVK